MVKDAKRIPYEGLRKAYILNQLQTLCPEEKTESDTAEAAVQQFEELPRANGSEAKNVSRYEQLTSEDAEAAILAKSSWLMRLIVWLAFRAKRFIKKIPVIGDMAIQIKEGLLNRNEISVDVSELFALDVNAFVQMCYQRLLGRGCSSAEILVYQRLICGGMPKEAVVYVFACSEEFNARYPILNLDVYKRIYRRYKIKERIKRIPIIGYLVRLILLPRWMEEFQIEYRMSAANQRAEELEKQNVLRALFASTESVNHCLKTQEKLEAEAIDRLSEQKTKLAELNGEIGRQMKSLALLTEEMERMTQSLNMQGERICLVDERLTAQTAISTSVSEKLDAQSQIDIAISQKLDDSAIRLLQSHTTVSSMTNGVIGVIVDGFTMGVPSEEWGLAMYLSQVGHFETGSEQFFERLLAPEMTVLDLGANLGIYSLRALRKGCNVIAYEPTPRTFRLLKQNIKVNGFMESGRIQIEQKAVSDVCGITEFYENPEMCGHNTLFPEDGDNRIRVETISLDSQSDLLAHKIDVIKIDIEGAEYKALLGMQHLLVKNHDVKIIMEFAPEHLLRAGVEPQALLDLVQKMGFVIMVINEATAEAELPVWGGNFENISSVNLYLSRSL